MTIASTLLALLLRPLPILTVLGCGSSPVPWAVDMCVGAGIGPCAALEDGRVACLDGPMGRFVVDLDAVAVDCSAGQLCVQSESGRVECWALSVYSHAEEVGAGVIQPDEAALPFTSWVHEWGRGCGVRSSGHLSCWGLYAPTYNLAPYVWRAPRDLSMTAECHVYVMEDGAIRVRKGDLPACGQDRDVKGLPLGATGSDSFTTSLDIVPSGTDWQSVSGGAYHACALDGAGRATCWGDGAWEEVTPKDSSFIQLASTYHATCGVTTAGTIECWEQAWDGEESYPDGFTIFDSERGSGWYNWIKTDVPFTDGWVQVGLTPDYGCGLDIAGQIRCFGAFPPGATLETALENPLAEPPCDPDSYNGSGCP